MPDPNNLPTVSLPGFTGETTLPPELLNNSYAKGLIKTGVTQWSKIAAWSWCEYLVCTDETINEVPWSEEDEEKLKQSLKLALTEQAKHSEAYISYGEEDSKTEANYWSNVIISLLLGDNSKTDVLVQPIQIELNSLPKEVSRTPEQNQRSTLLSEIIGKINEIPKTVTLSDLIEKITGEPLVTSIPENRAFVELFEVQVITGAFSGKVVYAAKGSLRPYISIIAYPPCPPILQGDTHGILKGWASKKDNTGSYLPPSAYIPIAVC